MTLLAQLLGALAVLGGGLVIALRRIASLMAENRRIAEEAETYAKTRNAIDEANRDPKTLMLPALLWLSACAASPAAERGLCDGLAPLAAAHTAALLEDAGEVSLVTGERLLAGLDAGCEVRP